MCSIKTLRLVLIPFLISVFGEINVHAGSYILPGYGGGGLTVYQFDPITEQVTISSVPPPTSITVQIDYDPGGLGPEYGNSYGATYYQPNFDFQISGTGSPLWPGYSVSLPVSVEISAPPPGGGLDQIIFQADSFAFSVAPGSITLYAPNGTISDATQPPATLDAFVDYGGGQFFFGVPLQPDYPEWTGFAFGSLGAVPEPPSIVTMSIGMFLLLSFIAQVRMTRRRPAVFPRQCETDAQASSSSPCTIDLTC